MQPTGVATPALATLFTPVTEPALAREWRAVLAARLFASTALLRREHAALPWIAVDTFWSLAADVRAAQLHEPLLSYARYLFATAAAAPATMQRQRVAEALELVGVVLVGHALAATDDRVRASAVIHADRFGRLRFPNWEGVVDVGPAHAAEPLSITARGGALTVEGMRGAAVPFRVVEADRMPRRLPGGLVVSWHTAYRTIGREVIERNRRIVEEQARAAERAEVLEGRPFPDGRQVLARLSDAASAMLHAVPEWYGMALAFAPVIVPIATPYAVGFSVDACRGAVFVAPEERWVDTVDHYVHEASHNRLDTFMELRPLYDTSDTRLLVSPWRLDPRPIAGLIHGIYSFGVSAHVLALVAAAGSLPPEAVEATVTRYCDDVTLAIDTVAREVALTSDGLGFVEQAAAFTDGTRALVATL